MIERCDVMIYVQHLLGVGHLTRAASIARACDRAGLSVLLVSGGPAYADLPLGGARFYQLPALRSRDAEFSGLVDDAGREPDDAFKSDRRVRLLTVFAAAQPKVLLIELYPFGRRQLRFELEPLVITAQTRSPRPRILCSLRDILNPPSSEAKGAWTVTQVRQAFDQVLVHGDPALAPLEASFPPAAELADKLRYTGYILEAAPSETPRHGEGAGEVLVSTGGGAVGGALIEAALAARPLSPLADSPWRILVGANLPETDFEAARARAPDGVTIERARPDFRALLSRARLSISQAGYNTTLEVLQAGCPAILVPFATPGEREQSLRAGLLAERGLVTLLPAQTLAPQSLAEAIGLALEREVSPERESQRGIDCDGAAKTAEILVDLAAIVPG